MHPSAPSPRKAGDFFDALNEMARGLGGLSSSHLLHCRRSGQGHNRDKEDPRDEGKASNSRGDLRAALGVVIGGHIGMVKLTASRELQEGCLDETDLVKPPSQNCSEKVTSRAGGFPLSRVQ
jgi:hypothetical protein